MSDPNLLNCDATLTLNSPQPCLLLRYATQHRAHEDLPCMVGSLKGRTSWAYNILQAHWIPHLSQSSEILTNRKLLNSGRHFLHLTKWSIFTSWMFSVFCSELRHMTEMAPRMEISALLMPKTANLRKGRWTKWPNPLRWLGCLLATWDIRGYIHSTILNDFWWSWNILDLWWTASWSDDANLFFHLWVANSPVELFKQSSSAALNPGLTWSNVASQSGGKTKLNGTLWEMCATHTPPKYQNCHHTKCFWVFWRHIACLLFSVGYCFSASWCSVVVVSFQIQPTQVEVFTNTLSALPPDRKLDDTWTLWTEKL